MTYSSVTYTHTQTNKQTDRLTEKQRQRQPFQSFRSSSLQLMIKERSKKFKNRALTKIDFVSKVMMYHVTVYRCIEVPLFIYDTLSEYLSACITCTMMISIPRMWQRGGSSTVWSRLASGKDCTLSGR